MTTKNHVPGQASGRPVVGHLCWMAAIMACCIWIQPLEGDARQIKSVVAFAIAIGLTAAYGAFHIGWMEGHHAGWRAGSDKPNPAVEGRREPTTDTNKG